MPDTAAAEFDAVGLPSFSRMFSQAVNRAESFDEIWGFDPDFDRIAGDDFVLLGLRWLAFCAIGDCVISARVAFQCSLALRHCDEFRIGLRGFRINLLQPFAGGSERRVFGQLGGAGDQPEGSQVSDGWSVRIGGFFFALP
jgi:hypothetical protein